MPAPTPTQEPTPKPTAGGGGGAGDGGGATADTTTADVDSTAVVADVVPDPTCAANSGCTAKWGMCCPNLDGFYEVCCKVSVAMLQGQVKRRQYILNTLIPTLVVCIRAGAPGRLPHSYVLPHPR